MTNKSSSSCTIPNNSFMNHTPACPSSNASSNFASMLKINEIAFSCYAVKDMARARQFYENVLNLKPGTVTDTANGQWVEYEIGPHTLALGCAPGFSPSPDGCSVALEVTDFEEAIKQLQAHQVKFRFEP